MAIKSIDNLCLYSYLKHVSLEGRTNGPPFPIIIISEGCNVIAAIKVRIMDVLHVDNAAALDGYGPTVYKVLMEESKARGISPAFKSHKEERSYIVPRSREIWKRFYEDKSVAVKFLEEKYDEEYLNFRYISLINELNVSRAKWNWNDHVKSKFRESLSLTEEIEGNIRIKRYARKYQEFREGVKREMFAKARALLEKSVEAHR